MEEGEMKILHRYILSLLIRNFIIGLTTFVFLFLVVDIIDRIDNVLGEGAPAWLIIQYFMCRVPLMAQLMMPVALIFASLFTYGLLSKSSEITAMRAAGITVAWLGRPLMMFGIGLSIFSFLLGEVIVPFTERRQKELYNIDIRQKDKKGGYSQSDFWFRHGENFYSFDLFDSRTNTIHALAQFEIPEDWRVSKRTDARTAHWIDQGLGWNMRDVTTYHFDTNPMVVERLRSLPLPIKEVPSDFYDVKSDPATMSFSELRRFIKKLKRNGISTTQYMPDLYSKMAAPLIIFITGMLVLPFTLLPARSGSMALTSIAAISIAFLYYAVDSFSISMGRAELLPPFLAAWSANIVMGIVAVVLNLGTEAPR
jgi:lipopolysaccharide export system permease protein